MKRRAMVPLILGLVIGLVAVKFAVDSIRKAQASNQAKQTFSLVRAKLDIDAHAELRPEMLEMIETSDAQLAPANERIEKLELATGRVTAKAIPKSVPVLLSMLSPEGTRAGMVGRIPPGFRAVSVKIDEVSGVAYQLQPGDWVDVIVVMDIDTGTRGKKETMAEVILQHVQVAAIGYGTSSEAEAATSKVKPAKSATLLIPEEEVPKLHLAGTRGKITLAMRGEDDKTLETPTVAYGSDILSGLRPVAPTPTSATPVEPSPAPVVTRRPAPVEPEPLPHAVMVFHGTTAGKAGTAVERITFENAHSGKIVEMGLGGPTRASAVMTAPKERARPATRQPASTTKEPAESADSDHGAEDDKSDSGD